MEDLLQSQIRESCRLALPNGLKELMSDISREVLRAQPRDIYGFIVKYLSSLLVTRENLVIATQLCDSVCECDCHPELEQELVYIGFDDDEASALYKVISEHFKQGIVNEANLLLKLTEKVEIEVDMIPYIQEAIRKAFQRHLKNHTTIYESSSDNASDETTVAVRRTLQLYRKSNPSIAAYNDISTKIQNSYKAYKESIPLGDNNDSTSDTSLMEFDKRRVSTASSISLAGSFLALPKHVPYSAHNMKQKEHHKTFPKQSRKDSNALKKKIEFHSSIKEFSIEASSNESSIIEDIPEFIEDYEDIDTNNDIDIEQGDIDEFIDRNIGRVDSDTDIESIEEQKIEYQCENIEFECEQNSDD